MTDDGLRDSALPLQTTSRLGCTARVSYHSPLTHLTWASSKNAYELYSCTAAQRLEPEECQLLQAKHQKLLYEACV